MANPFNRPKRRRVRSGNIHDDDNHRRRADDSNVSFREWRMRWRHTGKVLGTIIAVITAVLAWLASIASLLKDL